MENLGESRRQTQGMGGKPRNLNFTVRDTGPGEQGGEERRCVFQKDPSEWEHRWNGDSNLGEMWQVPN